MLPDWMIQKIEDDRRRKEDRRPQLEIVPPPPPSPVEKPSDDVQRGVITIQVWGD